MTTLLDLGDTGTHELGASAHTCGDNFTATDDLWQWKRAVTGSFMDYTEDVWDLTATNSIALVRSDGPAGPPVACKLWDDDWLAPV